MLQAQLTASLQTGPSSVGEQQFPSAATTIQFGLFPNCKQYIVATGGIVLLNTPSSFTPIDAIGSGGQVTQGLTIYCRSTSQMLLQATYANPGGGADIVNTEPLLGAFLKELPQNGYLKGLSIQGQGQLEFWCSGNV